MRKTTRGNLLDRTPSEVETSAFGREYALRPGESAGSAMGQYPRLRAKPQLLGDVAEVEMLLGDDGHTEVVALWLDRRWLNNKAQLPTAITAWARFIADALGELSPSDRTAAGNVLALHYDQLKLFDPLLQNVPYVPRDGTGAATEVFLGRRLEATAHVRSRGATVVFRNDDSGRMYTGVATQKAAFDLGALLFSAPMSFNKREGAGVAGWRNPELEATAFGKRFGLELDRAAPPIGRIARRYYGFERIARSAKVELMIEPSRGIAGVMLRVEQDWVEQSETNFFAALELIAGFVAEGAGERPDAAAQAALGSLFACTADDADLLKVIRKELPFAERGKQGKGTAVFAGEEDRAVALLDGGRVALVLQEDSEGWLDVLFHLTEFADEIGPPAEPAPKG